MKIGRIVLGVCQTNCFFLYEEDKYEVIVVDPADHGEGLYEKLKEAGFAVRNRVCRTATEHCNRGRFLL